MIFLWPHLLWLLLLCPALIALGQVVAHLRRRTRRESAPTGEHIRQGSASGGGVRFDRVLRGAVVPWRFWLAFALVILAIARPQWGRQELPPDARAPGEVYVALDLSRSMLAADAAPNRLERARALAMRLADELPDRKLGLIAFARQAYVVAPASEDRAILKSFLPNLRPEHMLEQGSNFGAMLDTALAAFGSANQGRALVILTDGEAEPSVWRDRLTALQGRGVRVIAMGFGSTGGAQILGADGKPLVAPTGQPIFTRMNAAPLVELARQTQGTYLDMARGRELAAVVRAASAEPLRGAAERPADSGPADKADQFAWFLIPALLLLAWSAAREFKAKPTLRRRAPVVASHGGLGVAAALLLMLAGPYVSRAQAPEPLLTTADLQGEEEPTQKMTRVVGEILKRSRHGAADYWTVMEAATRYGEIHRGHGHGLEEGLLRDGLAAIAVGRKLDPNYGDWAAAEAKLHRLLQKPPSVPPDPGPPDPANEPIGAQGQTPQGEDAKPNDGQEPPPDKEEPTEGDQGLQHVGGSEKDSFSAAEWRNAALVQPLDQLRKLKAEDNPADLFLLMQKPTPPNEKRGTQTW
jgi:Ca-activated chloride channel family protein